MDVTVPQIAEDVKTAEVVKVLVKVGDDVHTDQPLLELEGDKASFELPSPGEGTVTDICVSEGQDVEVGDLVLVLEAGDVDEEASDEPASDEPASSRRPRSSEDTADAAAEADESSEAAARSSESSSETGAAGSPTSETSPVGATPTARRRARELDVELDEVAAATSAPRLTADHVERHHDGAREGAGEEAPASEERPSSEPDTIELSRRRRRTGAKMTEAWRTIPHVTQHHRIDVTTLDASRRRLQESQGEEEPQVTWTALVLGPLATTLRKHPRFNASLDDDQARLHLHSSMHVAIAADTPEGLLAPVVRDVDTSSLRDVARALERLQRRIAEQAIDTEDLQGATFTLSNLGAIGGGHFTPIITPPQVAVLGLGQASRDHEAGPLWLPVSLSYDHRVADGAEAVRFLMSLDALLREPLALLYEG